MTSATRILPSIKSYETTSGDLDSMVERDDWSGLLVGRVDPLDALTCELPLEPSKRGGSGSFRAECSDGAEWWIKPPNHGQGGRVNTTELVVGGAGALIGAPTCEVKVVRIPPEIVGWEFKSGLYLVEGFGTASKAVPDVDEENQLAHRPDDDNERRHVGVYATYDWCWGSDDQWLYCWSDDLKIHSHDHGWYLPESGPDWSEATLLKRLHEAHPLGTDPAGLSGSEIAAVAARLSRVDRDELVGVLREVPLSWGVADSELEALGFFLESRAPEVADRLLKRTPGGTP